MERERPEYLQPIERRRLEFPWLAVIAVALIALMAGGVHMLTKTNAAWNERFKTTHETVAEPASEGQPMLDAERKAKLAEIRRKRAQAEIEAKSAGRDKGAEKQQLRCIDGTLFRRIPGGWENLPGESC
jgi:hypothetical protein